MGRLLLRNARLLDPEAGEAFPGSLLIADGRIEARIDASGPAPDGAEPVDLGGALLSPGFIDLHHHGATIFAAGKTIASTLRQDAASLVRHGTTAFLPTSVALPGPELAGFVTQLARCLTDGGSDGGALPIGIHLEGPWISPEAAGAQPRRGIRPFVLQEGLELLALGRGLIRMVTFAPEIAGAEVLAEELQRRGILGAIGHTRCDAAAAERVIERGVRHVTHLFNAMGPLHHREPGMAGRALVDDRLSCDLICDSVHVHADAVRLAVRAKGERLVLITDRIDPPGGRAGDRPPADLGIGALRDDGVAYRLPDGRLAGSRLTLDRAVRSAQELGAMTLLDAVAACTLRPARLLGIESQRGTLRAGARADLAVLSEAGEVLETWVEGSRVWRAAGPAAPG